MTSITSEVTIVISVGSMVGNDETGEGVESPLVDNCILDKTVGSVDSDKTTWVGVMSSSIDIISVSIAKLRTIVLVLSAASVSMLEDSNCNKKIAIT